MEVHRKVSPIEWRLPILDSTAPHYVVFVEPEQTDTTDKQDKSEETKTLDQR